RDTTRSISLFAEFSPIPTKLYHGCVREIAAKMQAVTGGGADSVLKVEQVSKRYGKYVALENLSFELPKGSHLLVLGPNGAGKTTLIKCIMDLINFNGKIHVHGIDVKKHSSLAKTFIGYVPQNYAFYEGISVKDHAILSTQLKKVGREQAEEKLKEVDLWRVKDKKVRALSDGMKQRLGIALALIANPPLLLLDEPTSNVDLRGQLEFQTLLKSLVKQGKTLLTTTHLTGLGELATQVMILNRGKPIAMGPPSELLKNLGVNDSLYVRVNEKDTAAVKQLLDSYKVAEVEARGEWIIAFMPSETKMKVVKNLLDGGIGVEDLLIERAKIESEYFKIIQGNKAA
ncbi:MAG: ABC transporter ATP-binding protein, partial [Candidatus Dormibacteraceae bacterium]